MQLKINVASYYDYIDIGDANLDDYRHINPKSIEIRGNIDFI
jgi:hypothetical protein